MIHSKKPQLSWEIGADHLHGILRVDAIRTQTLMQLVQHWNSDPQARDEVIAALDELADVVSSPRREGELDAAIEEVEDRAAMDDPQVEVDVRDARRLLEENAEAVRVAGKGRPSQGASLIKHPSHAATRKHLKANPLPEQQDRRSA